VRLLGSLFRQHIASSQQNHCARYLATCFLCHGHQNHANTAYIAKYCLAKESDLPYPDGSFQDRGRPASNDWWQDTEPPSLDSNIPALEDSKEHPKKKECHARALCNRMAMTLRLLSVLST